jgi:adenylate kinase
MLYRLLFERERKRIYVSFPISNVINRPEARAEIEEFKEAIQSDFTMFDPYTISEKKLDYLVQTARKAGQDAIECAIEGQQVRIPLSDVLPILPYIDSQIVGRDLQLVQQSDLLLAYYPCFEDGTPIHSAGREREIGFARDNGKEVFVIWPSITRDLGPFERDAVTKVFQTVGQARDYLVRAYPPPRP